MKWTMNTGGLMLLLIGVGCDHIPKRSEGSCLKSYYYGGPYQIKKNGWDLVVVDPKTKNEKVLPNDRTWKDVDCPK